MQWAMFCLRNGVLWGLSAAESIYFIHPLGGEGGGAEVIIPMVVPAAPAAHHRPQVHVLCQPCVQ